MNFTLSDNKRCSIYGVFRFRCRMQKRSYIYASSQTDQISKTCRKILLHFASAIKNGILNLQARSQFRSRPNHADKRECVLVLSKDIKDWIEKISFAERISQSEIIRMALEWWIEISSDKPRSTALKKWQNDHISLRIMEFYFSFWKYARHLTSTFPETGRSSECLPEPCQ
mgnify:FL=1